MLSRIIDHIRLVLGIRRFATSAEYWEDRYRRGGNSGGGSYGELAQFKAEFLNGFVERHAVASVVEFGCGDGSQLGLAKYPQYLGVDVSREAIAGCIAKYAADSTKSFVALADYAGQRADLAMSLDVIYHIVEDAPLEAHLRAVFGAAERWVVVYSTDSDRQGVLQSPHVKHRKFTDLVKEFCPGWQLIETIPNAHPQLSPCSFFVYGRREG